MRVKGSEVTRRQIDVEVDEIEVLTQMRAKVYHSLGMNMDMYLTNEGHLMEEEEHYHGSGSRRLVTATPSENQVKAIQAFSFIHSMLIRD
jgi:hypothetical protein